MKNFILTILVGLMCCTVAYAQDAPKKVILKTEPEQLVVETNKSAPINVVAYDEDGNKLEKTQEFYFVAEFKGVDKHMIFTKGVSVDSIGNMTGVEPGLYNVVIYRLPGEGEMPARIVKEISVVNQPIKDIQVANMPTTIYEGSVTSLQVNAADMGGVAVPNPRIEVSSSDPQVLRADPQFNLYAGKKGKATITFNAGSATASYEFEVTENPVAELSLGIIDGPIRTGDVVTLDVRALDKNGNAIANPPVRFAYEGQAAEKGSGASAMMDSDGRFVAEEPGNYLITAIAGGRVASTAVSVVPRNISREIKMTGHGSVSDQHTSDLWVWEGVDGKDYAVTGTWGSDGKAYFWDVTNPSSIIKIDSVQVDARTVNDVKVSEDGKVCVISREGASNRKNGIVILDVSNPRDVKEVSTFTEGLTGGVHNVFIYKNHVYALSNAQRYDIINIDDPSMPKKVGSFELANSQRFIHDVWVVDGIAYSSNWSDGVVMVDVGNGVAGGTPEKPVEIARARVEGDGNHAAFPYKSEATGKFYIVAGDEIFPYSAMESQNLKDIFIPAGYIHFMDMTDPDNPKEVARYEVPEAGSHNFWIEGDLLYIGYYNGGVRVVDISGDLMGDLYKQGREVAHYLPYDSEGFVPNAPFVWGAQPYKGHIFFSDFNSGLWSAQITPERPESTSIESR